MNLWKWWIIILLIICIFSIVESKSRRKPHHRHRHSKKHNSHRHNHKNKLSIRKKRSQIGEQFNHTSSLYEVINFTTILPILKTTQHDIHEYDDLEKIFGRIESQNITRFTTFQSPNTTETYNITPEKRQLFNLSSLEVLSDLNKIFGQDISESHVRVKRDNNKLPENSTLSLSNSTIKSSSTEDTIFSRRKRELDEDFELDNLYDENNALETRQRRFADTRNYLNDENSIYKNGLEDVYPEAVGDFEYHLPLAKLVRTKRLDNPNNYIATETKRDFDKNKIYRDISNALKTSAAKNNNNSRDKRQKKTFKDVGYINNIKEKPSDLEICNEQGKTTLNIKNIQTRSVQEVKKLAERLIAKVDELENSLYSSSRGSAKLTRQISTKKISDS